jgi:hypothetical protein
MDSISGLVIPFTNGPNYLDKNAAPVIDQDAEYWMLDTGLTNGLGFNIGHGLFVGWVEHTDILCWVSFLNPTYVPSIFLLSAKPNKMAEYRTVPNEVNH